MAHVQIYNICPNRAPQGGKRNPVRPHTRQAHAPASGGRGITATRFPDTT